MATRKPIARTADLHIGSKPLRKFKLTQDNTAVDVTGYKIRIHLLLTADDTSPLLSQDAVLDVVPSTGLFTVQFPELTETNTGGRDSGRLWRFLVWDAAGNPATEKPRWIMERVVAIR